VTKYFPKHSIQWHFEEPTVMRRFSLSLVEVAIITGIVLRLYRALVLSLGPTESWAWTGGTFAFGLLLLCAALTFHLANYPVQRWVWRAPAFALIEVAAEALTSLVLIWLAREPIGASRAQWADWPPMMGTLLLMRMATVVVWALVLAGVVTLVRRTVLRREAVEEEPVETV
jgi:hypothetical protein